MSLYLAVQGSWSSVFIGMQQPFLLSLVLLPSRREGKSHLAMGDKSTGPHGMMAVVLGAFHFIGCGFPHCFRSLKERKGGQWRFCVLQCDPVLSGLGRIPVQNYYNHLLQFLYQKFLLLV